MSITIQICGAARTVTGSCYLFNASTGRFLVDCGLFQGPKTLKALNYDAFPFQPADIDAVLLTHAHIDLCSYMLPDAGNIQETEVAALNRRNAARGRPVVAPIYTHRYSLGYG